MSSFNTLIRPIFITGTVIFGISSIITALIFVYFVIRGRRISDKLLQSDSNKVYSIHWLNSIWIYLSLFISFLLLTLLYATSIFRMGIIISPFGDIFHWTRWIILAIIGIFYIGCFSYILTDDNDHSWNKRYVSYLRIQSFFIVSFYVISFICIFFTSFTTDTDAKITLMFFSILFFIIFVILIFFPHNKFSISSHNEHDNILFTGNDKTSSQHVTKTTRTSIIFTYRCLILFFIVVSYIIYVIIWFLSKSNKITDTLHLQGQLIAYLVADFIYIVVFSFIFMVFTFYFKMKTIGYKDSETGKMHFKSNSLQLNSKTTLYASKEYFGTSL